MRSIAAAPHIFWAFLFIVVPLIIVIFYAFTVTNPDGSFSFSFSNIASLPDYASIFWLSLELSIIATAVCLVVGYPLAYIMARAKPKTQKIFVMLLMLPMWTNLLIRTYSLMAILDNGGILNTLLGTSFQIVGTKGAVIFGMVYDFLPYMVLPIYTCLSKIDKNMWEAAADLGCNLPMTLVKVILPAGMVIDENTIIEKVDVSELFKDMKDDTAPAVEEPAVEEPVVEEPVAEEPVVVPVAVAPATVEVRYRQSFSSRLIQSTDELKGFYSEIKNELLSYKGVKARMSWAKETFRKARVSIAKLDVKGKMIYVFLALDPAEITDTKYRIKDVSAKRGGDEYPTLIKVKSARGKNHAIELIRMLMAKLELVRIEREAEDFRPPYEDTEALVERGLIKVILPKGAVIDENTVTVKISIPDFDHAVKTETVEETPAEEAPIEETPAKEAPIEEAHAEVHIVDHKIAEEEIIHVDAVKADTIISDEQAQDFIETVTRAPGLKPKSAKCYEINLDTICENFEDDDVVTAESLKSKGLIPKKVERIKILARGVMTKKLTVIADKYSIQAVKMIGLAGGLAEKYKD